MILRDYLVALGFKVDENSWRRFNDRVASGTANVMRLGSTAAAAALEIGIATEKVAKQYEELYYAGQRTGSTVANLKATAFGFTQIGSSADASRAAIEGMASAARLNPGIKSMFAGMGVDMSNPSKGIGQLADVMKSRFGEAGYFVAARFAGMAGMDESTFRQIWMNREKLRAQEEEHLRRQKEAGIDTKKFSEDSVKFGDSLRELSDRWGLLIDRVAQDWLPVAQKSVETGNAITKWLTEANTASDGWLGTLGSIAAALGAIRVGAAALGVVGGLLGIKSATAVGAGVAGVSKLATGKVIGRGGGVIGAAIGLMMMMKGDAANGNVIRDQLRGLFGIKPDEDDSKPKSRAPASGRAGLARSIAVTAGNLGVDPLDLATVMSYETAGTFDKWKKGPTTQHGEHRGLIQWGEPQRAKYGVTKDSTVDEQMAAVEKYLRDAGVKPGAKLLDIYSAVNAGRVGRNNASDARNGGAPGTVSDKVAGMGDHRNNARTLLGADTVLASGAGGGGGVVINQKNDIKVSGVSDPKAAAGAVGRELDRTNGNIVRDTASAYH